LTRHLTTVLAAVLSVAPVTALPVEATEDTGDTGAMPTVTRQMTLVATRSSYGFFTVPPGGATIRYDTRGFDSTYGWPHESDGAYIGLLIRSLDLPSASMSWSTFFAPQRCPPPYDPLDLVSPTLHGPCEGPATIVLPPPSGTEFVMNFPPGPLLVLLVVANDATRASAEVMFDGLEDPGEPRAMSLSPVDEYGALWDARSQMFIDPIRTPHEPDSLEIVHDFAGVDRSLISTALYEADIGRIHSDEASKSDLCLENLDSGDFECAGFGNRPGFGSGIRMAKIGCTLPPGRANSLCGSNMRLRYQVQDRGPRESWILYGQTFDWQQAARDRNIPITPSA
jgi:hypothetical protein